MYLQELKLQNFRSFSENNFKFDQQNLVCGKNGSGKTNILEAIHLVCTGKSFRGPNNRYLIKIGKANASIFISIKFDKPNSKLTQSMLLKPKNQDDIKKELYRDGKKISALDFLGKMPIILFAPEELKMIWGTPKDRRAILDLLVTQFKPNYALKLIKLSQVLRQRNKLLFLIESGYADIKELDFWDKEFIHLGAEITYIRNQVINELNKYLTKRYRDISGTQDKLNFILASCIDPEDSQNNLKRISDVFTEKLKANLKSDLRNNYTALGPHRDEPKMFLNNQDINIFGSRGEGKTAVLALKFAQKDFFEAKLEIENCLFLLDDAFSELDKYRINYLLDNLGKEQSVFSATNIPPKLKSFNIIKL